MTEREADAVTNVSTELATPTELILNDLLCHLLGGLPDRYRPETELFGSLPELDSLALVELITAIEERFSFEMDEDDITGAVFATVSSLARHVDESTT